MVDRVNRIRLEAEVSDYVAGLEKASVKTRELGSDAEKLAAKSQAFTLFGQAMVAAGAAAAAGVGVAVSKFADFDQAMSNVAAATHESEENMVLLRDAALEAGARTVFSATESAEAIEELGKAGLSTADILSGGLDGALDLAAAGGLDVGQAAGIAAVALKQFNLEGSDMGHVADLLAAGAGKAMGDVTDLSAALSQAGQVASSTGLDIEETTAGLSAFASAGLLGSDAGTSFKSMLQRLTPQSAEAQKKMDELGITAYDAQGNFIGLSEFAGNLQTSLADLTVEQRNSALATIFGSDAVRAATVLYTEGADGIEAWEQKVNDAGYASETAAKRLDNLKGDVEQLGGALETALITTGENANGVLRDLVQTTTGFVDLYNEAPDVLKAATLGIGSVTAAAGLAGGAFFLAVPKVAEFNAALATMGPNAQRAGRAVGSLTKLMMGPWGAAFLAAGLVAAGFAKQSEAMSSYVDELTDSLDENTGAVTKNTKEVVKNNLASSKVWEELADTAGVSLDLVADAILGNADAAEKLRNAYEAALIDDGYVKGSEALATAMGVVNNFLGAQQGKVGDATNAWQENQNAQKDSEDATNDNSAAMETLTGKVHDSTGAINDFVSALREVGSGALDLREAERNVKEAVEDATEAIEENGKSVDDNTEAGRANNEAIDGIASSYIDLVSQMAENGASQEELTAKMEEGRKKFIEAAMAAGHTKDEAADLADELGLMPDSVDIAFNADTSGAQADIEAYMRYYGTQVGTIIYRAQLPDTNGDASGNGKMGTYADGGMETYANAVGNMYDFQTGIYAGRAGAIHKFAEPETGWEAYISGRPGKEGRNIGIAYEALARLGALPQPQIIMGGGGNSTGAAPLIEGGVHISSQTVGSAMTELGFELRKLRRGGR